MLFKTPVTKGLEALIMHEIGIAQQIVEIAEESARAQSAKSISKISLRIGAMSGVVPEALDFAFESVKLNTLASNADLEVEYIDMVCLCENCNLEFESKDNFGIALCPLCGMASGNIIRGNEMDVISIEVIA